MTFPLLNLKVSTLQKILAFTDELETFDMLNFLTLITYAHVDLFIFRGCIP